MKNEIYIQESTGKKFTFQEIEEDIAVPTPDKKQLKVALVIGHHSNAKGASSETFGCQEWDLFESLLRGWESNVFQPIICKHDPSFSSYTVRQGATADSVAKIDCDLAIEFHFDSYNGKANGQHGFYYLGNKATQAAVEQFNLDMSLLMGIKTRSNKPVRNGDSFNGSGFILQQKVPAILLECFFGDNESDCKKFNPEKFATVLNNMVKAFEMN